MGVPIPLYRPEISPCLLRRPRRLGGRHGNHSPFVLSSLHSPTTCYIKTQIFNNKALISETETPRFFNLVHDIASVSTLISDRPNKKNNFRKELQDPQISVQNPSKNRKRVPFFTSGSRRNEQKNRESIHKMQPQEEGVERARTPQGRGRKIWEKHRVPSRV